MTSPVPVPSSRRPAPRLPLSRAVARAVPIAIALAHLPVAASAQSLTAAESARVDSVFSRFAGASPGCALDVHRAGAQAYAKGYGLASLELGVPITPKTVFDLGSTSKQITSAAVALLAIDGKLSLDDDIRKHVPELPDLGHTITLRHLLTHTSGWRDYIDIMIMEGWDDRDHTTDREALAALVRQRALNYVPGTDHRYSNTGYFLAAEVVKRVSGKSLAEFARERIFEPLGMKSTRYLTDAREVIPGKATGYQPAPGGKWLVAMSDWEQVGDGGVQSTVEDLALWDANLETGKVGGKKLIEMLTTTMRLNDGTPLTYALGINVDEYGGRRRLQHGGAWAGFRAHQAQFPTERVSILLACNAANANTMQLVNGVADALFGKAVASAAATNGRAGDGAAPGTGIPTGMRAADLAGTYFAEGAMQLIRLTADGDSLVVAGPRRLVLQPVASGHFRHPANGADMRFERDARGHRWLVQMGQGRPTALMRVDQMPEPAPLADYAGTYASEEAGTEWKVSARDGGIAIQRKRGQEEVLRPAFRDAFVGPGIVRFERDASGRVVALRVSTRGAEALRFEKR